MALCQGRLAAECRGAKKQDENTKKKNKKNKRTPKKATYGDLAKYL